MIGYSNKETKALAKWLDKNLHLTDVVWHLVRNADYYRIGSDESMPFDYKGDAVLKLSNELQNYILELYKHKENHVLTKLMFDDIGDPNKINYREIAKEYLEEVIADD